MPWVHVFCKRGYEWKTSVAKGITEEDAKRYFVGTWFNVGRFDEPEKMSLCVRIEYHHDTD